MRKGVCCCPQSCAIWRAVGEKLKELNPGFDGEVKATVENGVVVGLEFLTDKVFDIRPVRALSGLKSLSCRGSYTGHPIGMLADLSPLADMALKIGRAHV